MAQTQNNTAKNIRDIVAVLLAVVALTQLVPMVTSESFVNPWHYNPETQFDIIRKGFQHYCTAFGWIIMLVGAGFLLLGYNDKLDTNPNKLTEDDEF